MSLKEKHVFATACFLCYFIYPLTGFTQQWEWVINGTGDNQYSNADRDIAVDNEGNQFIAGYFTETLKLGQFKLVNPDDYYSDMFLAKIDRLGNVVWAKAIELGSTYNDAVGICLDDADNIFLTGANQGKIFVSKYNSSGAMLWNSDIMEKNFYGYGRDIAIDPDEHVYITGVQDGGAITAKLNWEGKLDWIAKIQGCHSNGALGNDLAVDRLGNCYMTGAFECDSVVVGDKVLYKQTGNSATFLIKYSTHGNVVWAQSLSGATSEKPQIALSESGQLILAGLFYGQLTFADNIIVTPWLSGMGSYIAKYDTSGNLIWARNGSFYESNPMDLVVDYDDNIYLTGTRFGNFGGSEMDFHFIKYNSIGDTLYSQEILAGSEYAYGIDIDGWGNFYLVGHADVVGLGVIGPGYINPYSVFAAKISSGSTTRKRTNKPVSERIVAVCLGNNTPLLNAWGVSVRWYKDAALTNLLANGNTYQPTNTKTDTFYVTQTVNNIQSWPKQVIVYYSTIANFAIEKLQDSLFAPADSNYTYRWYRDSIPIADSIGGTKRGIKPVVLGKYKVVVNDRGCKKDASYFYYADICPGSSSSFVSNLQGFSFVWQVSPNNGLNYYNIVNNGNYSGANTNTLTIHNPPSLWRSYTYRCFVDGYAYSKEYQLLFQSKWTGTIDNSWEKPGNWSCGQVPDSYMDILIGAGQVVLHSDANVRSIRVSDGATFTIHPGFTLTVAH